MPCANKLRVAHSLAILAAWTAADLRAQLSIASIVGGGPKVGTPATAAYAVPYGVAWDSLGGFYFTSGNQILHVNRDGAIDLVMGNGISGFAGDGGLAVAPTVELASPVALATDASGNLYIADQYNNRVRRVDAVSGIISTVAGTGNIGRSGDNGPATGADLFSPVGVAVDSSGNVYIADSSNRVRKVAAGTGTITTVAGNGNEGFSGDGGPAINAMLSGPHALAVDGKDNLYIADQFNYRIRKVTAAGVISTVAGNGLWVLWGDGGPALDADIGFPTSVVVDSSGNIFIASGGSIRKVDSSTGIITLYAGRGAPGYSGNGGLAIDATFTGGGNLAVNSSGDLLFADSQDSLMLKINGATHEIDAVAGNPSVASTLGNNGPAAYALLSSATNLAVDSAGDLYIGDARASRVRKVSALTGIITTYAGDGSAYYTGDAGLAVAAGIGNIYFNWNGAPFVAPTATPEPIPLAFDSSGNGYLMATGGNTAYSAPPPVRIRKVSVQTGIITLFGGGGTLSGSKADNGPATSADLTNAQSLAADSTNLYIADAFGKIRAISLSTGVISTPAPDTYASAITEDSDGDFYFTSGDAIDKYTASTNTITTVAGFFQDCQEPCDRALLGTETGAQLGDGGPAIYATLNAPQAVAADRFGNLYIADTGAHRIRFVSAETGIISTIAGTNATGCSTGDGVARNAYFSSPSAVALDRIGNLYIADTACNEVFKLMAHGKRDRSPQHPR